MLLLYSFALFQKFSSVFWILLLTLIYEIIKIRAFSNNVRMIFECVNYDVEKADCTAGIISILFHKKHVFGDCLGIEAVRLLFFVIVLYRG